MTIKVQAQRPLCTICGRRPVKRNGSTVRGLAKWSYRCAGCHKKPYTRHKKKECEFCGFVPVNPCQLDVDHIDGDKKNDTPSNLQTLCANCHRLKTFLNSDWEG